MLLGIITVYVLYLFIKKIYTKETALIGAFLLAISPWHIIISRYGLESNLAIFFVLLGAYFAILGIEKEKYFIISSAFWGLSLYCYAVCWFFVPLFLICSIFYCLYTKKLKISRYLILSGILLFIMAVPLLLFVMVNVGIISEIRTSWFSIPKLVVFRNDEVSVKMMLQYAVNLFRLFITQNDYHIWNVSKWFGIYYLFSTPLVAFGVFFTIRDSVREISRKQFCYQMFLTIWMLVGIIVAIIQGVGITRNNTLILINFVMLGNGIKVLCDKCGKTIFRTTIVVYMACFLIFEGYYFTTYQSIISEEQVAGADEALDYALSVRDSKDTDKIYITGRLRHPHVLFYTQFPTDEYLETVKWKKYPNRYLSAASFGCFTWREEDKEDSDVLIILAKDAEQYEQENYDVTYFKTCAVAVRN